MVPIRIGTLLAKFWNRPSVHCSPVAEARTVPDKNLHLELFIQKIRKYVELTELTPYAAHELIKAIYVGAPDKSSGKRRQSIHICYDLIGFIPLSELMEQEMA